MTDQPPTEQRAPGFRGAMRLLAHPDASRSGAAAKSGRAWGSVKGGVSPFGPVDHDTITRDGP